MTEIFAETFLVYIKNIAVDKTRIEKSKWHKAHNERLWTVSLIL